MAEAAASGGQHESTAASASCDDDDDDDFFFFFFFNRRAPLTLYILSIRVITAVFFISADFHTAPSMCVRHHRADNKVFKISYSVSCPHHSLHSPGRGAALIWDQWCIGELCSIAAAGAPPPQRKTRGARWWGGKFYCS